VDRTCKPNSPGSLDPLVPCKLDSLPGRILATSTLVRSPSRLESALLQALRKVNAYTQAAPAAPGRRRGNWSPAVLWQWAPLWICGRLATAIVLKQVFGGRSRWITARASGLIPRSSPPLEGYMQRSLAAYQPDLSRGGLPFGKLSGGNWIGRMSPCSPRQFGAIDLGGESSNPGHIMVTLKPGSPFGAAVPALARGSG